MKILKYSTALILFVSVFLTCTKPPDYPIEPKIEYVSASKTTLRQSAFNDDFSLITFSFTDGDGDIGARDSLTLFLSDLRGGFDEEKLRIPFVPELGRENGIRGEITFKYLSACCIYPDPGLLPCTVQADYPTDTLILQIHIKDRAGNLSNTIETEPLVLLCN